MRDRVDSAGQILRATCRQHAWFRLGAVASQCTRCMTLDAIVQCISQANMLSHHILQCMSNDATELVVRRSEFVNFTTALTIDFLKLLKFLVAISNFTFKFNVALSSILSDSFYFSGGRSSFAFVIGFATNLNAWGMLVKSRQWAKWKYLVQKHQACDTNSWHQLP
jgi:hypothetical protein